MIKKPDRKIILENGSQYLGMGFADQSDKVVEIVFNTSMVGYQEILSDPSYTDQGVVFTYPLIGNYGTVIVTLADEDKEEALPLIKRFYDMGFNIEATIGTADFLKAHGIRTRVLKKLSEGSTEILEAIRAGYVSYIVNTRAILSGVHYEDGVAIRNCAVENGIKTFTSLDTVKVLLDVLEEITMGISTIDS